MYPPPYFGYPPIEVDNRSFWEKYQYIIIGVGVVVMLIVLGLIIRAIVKAAEQLKTAPKGRDYDYVTDPNTGQLVVTNDPLEGYDPLPLATRLVEAFKDSWFFGWGKDRCNTTYEANNLSTNRLIAVAHKYKQIKGVSLYSDLTNSSFDGCWTIDYSYVLAERLREEKLT